MSPALKSKAKNKSVSGAAKEQSKIPSKSSAPGDAGNVPANAYNPILGTFHALEMGQPAISTSQNDGRFINIDEIENRYGNYVGYVAEYDSIINNETCSESEDQKDKPLAPNTSAQRPEPIPGCDNDKREKIRQKNEKKHQRQKERRALELHDRCTGFLMARKLDILTEKLVGMGFGDEHATRALMLNEGKVEDSVSWLLEGGMDAEPDTSKLDSGSNMKIDIADELAKIAELEIKFNCVKQEVERAVVSCEGNLEKAEEILKSQKQEQAAAAAAAAAAATSSKAVKSGDTIALNETTKVASTSQNQISRATGKSVTSVTIQAKRDERDLNYPKNTSAPVVPDLRGSTLQPSMKMQPKTGDWPKNVAMQNDRRLPSMGPTTSASYSLSSTLQQVPAPAKVEPHRAIIGNEGGGTNFQAGSALKEPVIMMQRPQPLNVSSNQPSTSMGINGLPQFPSGWNPNGLPSVDVIRAMEGGRQNFPIGSNFLSSNQPFYQTQHFVPATEATGWVGSSSWNHGRSSHGPSPLTTPSSLGLFTGGNHVGPPRSPLDWNAIGGTMPEFDYTNIDWSMDLSSSTAPTLTSQRSDRPCELWPASLPGARPVGSNAASNGMPLDMLDGSGMLAMDPTPYMGSRDWTTPFAGKDIFMLPRQFVSSTSLQ